MWRHATTATHGYRIPPVRVEWLYNPQGRSSWAVVPSLAGVVVMISTLLLGALTLVRERERGTWEGLVATPISGIDALVGKLSPYVLIGIAQAGVVLGLAHLLFDLPFRGPLSALLFAAALLGVAHLVTGFAISALARTQVQAIQGAVFFYLPSMLLSGFIFPFSGMPSWAQHVGEALPLTHFVRAARAVTLRADGWSFVTPELVPIGKRPYNERKTDHDDLAPSGIRTSAANADRVRCHTGQGVADRERQHYRCAQGIRRRRLRPRRILHGSKTGPRK